MATTKPSMQRSGTSRSRASLDLAPMPTAGRLGHLTPEQQQALDQFRSELKAEGVYDPIEHDEYTLLRFLRARRFDVPKTKFMFSNYLKWRHDFGVDELTKTFVFAERPEIDKIYPRYYHSTDKAGRPVYVEHLGKLDIRSIFKLTTEERFMKNHVVEYEKTLKERFVACSWKAHRHIEQSCTIIDLKGVAITQFPSVSSFVKHISAVAQDYYPETLGRMYIINAPMLFTSVWSVVKLFLDEATVQKIQILGSRYQPTLLENIDEKHLPQALGGKCVCPGGCEHSGLGPWNEKDAEFWREERIRQIMAVSPVDAVDSPTSMSRTASGGIGSSRRSSSLQRKRSGSLNGGVSAAHA
ncbi:CRAL-TRIO domain-containing protein [Hyaloraphidium curvatum]|nr:CRAL-TRIO domain-containing protein [Hyaloraphidium curvatum]